MSLRIAILGVLSESAGSGYDLLKRFETSLANVWSAPQSQLYGELKKLADAGFIEVSDIGPRRRKEYRITDAGRAELRQWVANPNNRRPFRSAKLLRMFLLNTIGPQQAREHVASMIEHADAEVRRLQDLRHAVNWSDSDRRFYSHAALEYGLQLNIMEADLALWLMEAIDMRDWS